MSLQVRTDFAMFSRLVYIMLELANHRVLFRISADKAEAEDVVCGQRPESSPERRHGRRYSLQHLSGPHRHRRLPLGGHRLHPRLPQEINNFRALVMFSNMLRLYSDLKPKD